MISQGRLLTAVCSRESAHDTKNTTSALVSDGLPAARIGSHTCILISPHAAAERWLPEVISNVGPFTGRSEPELEQLSGC